MASTLPPNNQKLDGSRVPYPEDIPKIPLFPPNHSFHSDHPAFRGGSRLVLVISTEKEQMCPTEEEEEETFSLTPQTRFTGSQPKPHLIRSPSFHCIAMATAELSKNIT